MANNIFVKGLYAGYGSVSVLRGIDLTLESGDTVAMLGTNGNGKTTLMRCLTGQLKPNAGEIIAEIDGERHDLTRLGMEEIVALGISLVPEGRRLFPKLTVEENLILGCYRKSVRSEMARNMAFCYDAFPRLAERRRQLAGSMSGGEQQMLAIGRALMGSPKILLVDEPSVGLAPILVTRMIDKIAELKNTLGLTVLMAEQNFEQATRIADRGYVLVHGQVAFAARNIQELRDSDVVRKLYFGS